MDLLGQFGGRRQLREFPVAAGGVKFVERKRLTRQESRLVTRAKLVDAAEKVFLREGFDQNQLPFLQGLQPAMWSSETRKRSSEKEDRWPPSRG